MDLFGLIFIGIFGFAAYNIFKGIFGDVKNSGLPVEKLEAIVVSKRLHVTGGEHGGTFYYATFELANDTRLELRVSGTSYGTLAEGDRGILAKQGTRFVSFERTDDPYDARGASQREHKCESCGAPYTGRVCPYCGTPYER